MESPAGILMRMMRVRMAENDCRLFLASLENVCEEPAWQRAWLLRMLRATRTAGRFTGRVLGLVVKNFWRAASNAFDEAK